MALSPFTWGSGGRRMTPEEIAFQRRIAARQMQSDYSPIYSPWQGWARVADNVTGALRDRQATRAQERNAVEQRELLANLLMQPAAQPQPQMTMPAPEQPQALAPDDFAASIAGSLQQAEPIDLTSSAPTQAYQDAISAIESGAKGYGAIGPTHNTLGRALGKYQVMEANIGPWSREALGRTLTPEEFLASPEAQDAIFNHKFGEYAERFGPGGAAEAWFAGPGGVGRNRRDALGTSTQDYRQRFLAGLDDAGTVANPVAEALMMDSAVPTEPMPQQQTQQFAMAQPAQQQAINPAIVEALASPYTDDATKQIAMALFQQQAAGPAAQQLVKAGDGVLYDPASGQWLTAPGYGQEKPSDLPSSVREYQFAQGQGYRGSFEQFARAMAQAKATNVTTNVNSKQMGPIPAGYRAVYDAQGNVTELQPIEGSPAAVEASEQAAGDAQKAEQRATWASVVQNEVGRALDLVNKSPGLTTGIGGQVLSKIGGTGANDLQNLLMTIRANAGFDRLQAMRDASKTGGALGQVSDIENKLLQSTIGSLEQSQTPAQLNYNLRRVKKIYDNMLNGKRAYDGLDDVNTPRQTMTGAVPAGVSPDDWKFMTPEERELFR